MPAAAIIEAAGGVLSAYGSYRQGQDTAKAYESEALQQEQDAEATLNAARANAARQQIIANSKIGEINANYAASGVSNESGSVMAVLEANHANAEMDRLNIIYGGELKAIAHRNQASIDRAKGANAKTAGNLSAYGSLLGSGGKTMGMFKGSSPASSSTPTDIGGIDGEGADMSGTA